MKARKTNGRPDITAMTAVEDLPSFVTPEEFAHLLDVGKSTAYELCRQNKIRSLKVGRCTRIPKRAVLEFIDAGGAELPKQKEASA